MPEHQATKFETQRVVWVRIYGSNLGFSIWGLLHWTVDWNREHNQIHFRV